MATPPATFPSISTNCGDLNLESTASKMIQEFEEDLLKTTDSASITKNRIRYFHRKIVEVAYNIPLKVDWVVLFNTKGNRNSLLEKIKNISNYEGGEWKMQNSAEVTFHPSVQDTIGCIFAQGVKLPGEDIKIEYTAGTGRGFINAPFVTGRSDSATLDITFLETKSSFVDSFLRPWSILVAHNGLIASEKPDDSIKVQIVVHQMIRDTKDACDGKKPSAKDSIIRKTFVFEDCAPINIATEELTYGSSTDFSIIQTQFVFSRYYIQEDTKLPVRNSV
jgi:hypothetical protein